MDKLNNFSSVFKKELKQLFSSSIACIFILCFLAVNLFAFFWIEGFFARNIADVKPLFEWLPITLIFLVSALTMKMWSEEKKQETIDVLFSSPKKRLAFVLGKFFACLVLVAISLIMTFGVPITIAFLGNLDFGPVIGAYIASIFLASFYIAIGLYISAKTDNQIVSLITSILILSVFYILGANFFTAFFNNGTADILRLIGSGSRFESIVRGVLDIRDIYYYLSLTVIFLALNLYTLKSLSWDKKNQSHLQTNKLFFLIIANIFLLNFTLNYVNFLRVDLTKDNRYSISNATKDLITSLEEPLTIKGYFSKKTHPLLSPLVPQLKDLIKEYKIRGKGKIDISFIDPKDDPEEEKLIGSKFGIRPIPFQIADKYEASLVNSYFDILVEYGDKFEKLNFQDLIEIKVKDETNIEVLLKNPEYDITRSIKKVLFEFKDTDTLLSELDTPLTFNAYISDSALLPDTLKVLKNDLKTILDDFKSKAPEKFTYNFIEPTKEIAKELYEKFGFQPMVGSLLDKNAFYFYMLIDNKSENYQVLLPNDYQKSSLEKSIENTLKRFSKGYIKTVGVSSPKPDYNFNMQAYQRTGKNYQTLLQKLQETYKTKVVDLESGIVPEDVDILLVNAPSEFNEKAVYAVDQFLMKGGSIIFNTATHQTTRMQDSIRITNPTTGLEDWFKNYGITFSKELVLDEDNENYPVPMKRDIGGLIVTELKMIPYPMYVDVRDYNSEAGIMGGISQVTLNFTNEIQVDKEKNSSRTVTPLLYSSKKSWKLDTNELEPNFVLFPKWGFRQTEEKGPFTLAYIIEGAFDSYFNGKENPFSKPEVNDDAKNNEGNKAKEDDDTKKNGDIVSFVTHSPSSSKIIIFASNEFVEDSTLRVSASTGSSRYMNSLKLIENTIDWSLEDKTLLSIRGKTNFSETLKPISKEQKEFYEILNYLISSLLLLGFYIICKVKRQASLKKLCSLVNEK